MPTQADTPHSLVRRYEVAIIPPSGAKARKLREIKAVGKSSIAELSHVGALTGDCLVCQILVTSSR
jgi:hypothetical protein